MSGSVRSDVIFHYRMNPDKRRFSDKIGNLEKRLYSRSNQEEYEDERTQINRPDITVEEKWQGGEPLDILVHKSQQEKEEAQGKLFKKILIGAVVFFVLSIGVALFLFFGGNNMVSANNIDIRIIGPATIAGGEELSLEVVIQNKNNANLEGVSLLVEYPEGTRLPGTVSSEFPRERQVIGDIPARGEVRKTVKAVLFGEKDSISNIKFTLEYRLAGSSALFYKDKNYDIGLTSSPIIITPQYPAEVNSNREFSFVLDITSNTTEDLENILVRAEYPFGFTFVSATPKPVGGNDTWSLGDMAPGDKREIEIRGIIQGQDNDERTFRFLAGIAESEDGQSIDALLTALSEQVVIKRPFVSLTLNVGNQSGSEYSAKLSERIPVTVVWTNNLPTPVLNAQITVGISGDAFDKNLVIPSNGGFFRSLDNSIVWDKSTTPNFASIEPGARGTVSFSLATVSQLPSSARSPEIPITVSFTGSQTGSDNTPQMININNQASIKIASSLTLSASGLHNTGAFENSGPFPPKADEETTYTIVFSISNSFNDMENTVVTATLPPYVKWNSLVSPSNEPVSFDSNSNILRWNVGRVKGGTGFDSSPRKVSFQITLTPSVNQVGTSPVLVSGIDISAEDSFTGQNFRSTRPDITTRITSDPGFEDSDGVVVK